MEMIFMKRAISFLLVLVFCFSLACPAFAAVNSPAEYGPSVNPKTGDIIRFWVAVMVVCIAALGAVCYIYRRKFSR